MVHVLFKMAKLYNEYTVNFEQAKADLYHLVQCQIIIIISKCQNRRS